MATGPLVSAFDVVGAYSQDEINGFEVKILDHLVSLIAPDKVSTVLDAMAGDGNLSERLYKHCVKNGITAPSLVALEYSRVQAEFARMRLQQHGAKVIWGDILSMTARDSGEQIPDSSFERVMIKSANHEIPYDQQLRLYSQIYRVLEDGGVFVNLGFLFDNEEERDEFRSIARVKDSLAQMTDAVHNRHFLTRDELYSWLTENGFVDIYGDRLFDYRIRSSIVARHYFQGKGDLEADIEHQVAQVRAVKLRRKGRILFERDESIMLCPGEITVARKPTAAERRSSTYSRYPYDFLRKIEAHRMLLREAASFLPIDGKMLDLGCGLGLLFEHVQKKASLYVGVDYSEEFINVCRERYTHFPNAAFHSADLNESSCGWGSFDVVSLINVLYHEGIQPIRALRNAYDMVRPGGLLLVSGPLSNQSFIHAEPRIRAQLERDGYLAGNESTFEAILAANEALLTAKGNYWSAEGMAELLKAVGFRSIEAATTDHFYGQSYLVAARR